MSRELRIRYKNIGFVAQMSNNRYNMYTKRNVRNYRLRRYV